MRKSNMIFTQEQLNRLNLIVNFLALRDKIPEKVDLMILLGSSLISHLGLVAEMYHLGRFESLIIAGGIGHSTKFLYENMESSGAYRKYLDENLAEADIYRNILMAFYQIPAECIRVENKSTNCGNNASYAYETVVANGLVPKTALLIQDPTMQRRSYASFLKEWQTKQVKFYNYAPYVPKLALTSSGDIYFEEPLNPAWTLERYVELVMGEIPRLRDDENGYGPKGKGFIAHVDIPDAVERAYKALDEYFGEGLLKRNGL